MKLAEALAQRADIAARLGQLKQRAQRSARHQEGETPAEDAGELLAEHGRLADDLEGLIRRINATNLATELEPGVTVTDALARRDVLRLRHRMHADLADAGGSSQDRFTRTELRSVAAVDVRELRSVADELAREYRMLDTRIQQVNWTVELIE